MLDTLFSMQIYVKIYTIRIMNIEIFQAFHAINRFIFLIIFSSFTFYGLPKKSPNKKTSLKVFYSL